MVLYLAIIRTAQLWTMPILNWPVELDYFSTVLAGRLPARLNL
jgi:hypothetical protein